MQDEKLIEEICAARFSEIPGHWTDGLTPGIIAIERMKAERLLPIIARERENAAAAQKERDAQVADEAAKGCMEWDDATDVATSIAAATGVQDDPQTDRRPRHGPGYLGCYRG